MIGTTVGGYEITEALAEGGMGAVWAARHSVMDRTAVVKLLHPEFGRDPEIVQRFLNEARAAASIDDPGIVQVFDVGHLPDGRAYIVMERLGGQTLAQRLRQRQSEPPSKTRAVEAVQVLRLLARTLIAAHEEGIVHRDLKPENIFLVPDPDVAGGERTKIVDFGIAKLASSRNASVTRAGSTFGTPAYMAPEQCTDSGSVDARADLYALGCIAYEMLVGQPPFGFAGIAVIAAQLYNEPTPLRERDPAIPEELANLVARLLRKNPAERYASSAELYAALDALALHPDALHTPRPFDIPPTVPPTKRERPAPAPLDPASASAATTMSATSGSASTPRASSSSKLPYVIAGLSVVAMTIVIVVLVTNRSSAPTPPPAAAAPVEQGNALADAIQAQSEQRWEDAIAAAASVTRDGDKARAQAILATARAEAKHQRALVELEHAIATGDLAMANRALSTIDPKSFYRARAEQAVRAAEDRARVAATPTEVPAPIVPVKKTVPKKAPPPTKATPTVRQVEAGPIWDTADAGKKCPTVCKAPARWNGGWRTTIPNQMSTCDCETR